MIQSLKQLNEAGSWNAMRAEMGALLGIDEPVSSAVLNRARQDDKFALYLMRSRHNPATLRLFLDSPQNKAFEIADPETDHSNSDLAKRAGKALLKWGKSGFKKVDQATFDQRYGTCEQCEFLKEPPQKLAYQVALAKKSSAKVCGACGCVAAKKAWLPTDTCPVEDPGNKGFNFWGEPVKQGE